MKKWIIKSALKVAISLVSDYHKPALRKLYQEIIGGRDKDR
jgi:hypothetical protein